MAVIVSNQNTRSIKTFYGFKINQIIYFFFGLLESLLIIRFFLRLLGANPASGFVNFIYKISNPFVEPFFKIFGDKAVDANSVVEFSTIIALVAYIVLAILIERFVYIITSR